MKTWPLSRYRCPVRYGLGYQVLDFARSLGRGALYIHVRGLLQRVDAIAMMERNVDFGLWR